MRNDQKPRYFTGRPGVLIAVGLVVGLLLTSAVWYLARPKDLEITAAFPRAVGLYKGDDVRVLGVRVGRVKTIERAGDHVNIRLEVDHGVDVPAGASAVMIAPTLVSGRYVQLTPAYTSGAKMPTGGVIPKDRAHVPVEFDELKTALNKLGTDLGPDGRSKDGKGPLGRAIDVASANLDGQGQSMHDTLESLAGAVNTLAGSKDDIFATVRSLAEFTDMLVRVDSQMRSFTTNMAQLTGEFADSRALLATTLKKLDQLMPELQTYLKTNRPLLKKTVSQLGDLSQVLSSNNQNLADILQVAPTTLSNTYNIYDPVAKGQVGSLVLPYQATPGQVICYLFGAVGAANQCPSDLLDGLVGSADASMVAGKASTGGIGTLISPASLSQGQMVDGGKTDSEPVPAAGAKS